MPNTREKLVELLTKYFDIGDSYAYNLTRVKSAFACGTIGFDDFEEFDDETVADIADHLIANGVTVQQWISVKDRLPEEGVTVLVCGGRRGVYTAYMNCPDYWHKLNSTNHYCNPTHWMPLPQPPKEGADNG